MIVLSCNIVGTLFTAMRENHRSKLQEQLTTLIMRVLVNNPQLHYYQVGGYPCHAQHVRMGMIDLFVFGANLSIYQANIYIFVMRM